MNCTVKGTHQWKWWPFRNNWIVCTGGIITLLFSIVMFIYYSPRNPLLFTILWYILLVAGFINFFWINVSNPS